MPSFLQVPIPSPEGPGCRGSSPAVLAPQPLRHFWSCPLEGNDSSPSPEHASFCPISTFPAADLGSAPLPLALTLGTVCRCRFPARGTLPRHSSCLAAGLSPPRFGAGLQPAPCYRGEAAGAGSVPPATRRPSAGYGAAGRAGRRPLEGRRYRWKGGDAGLGAGREETGRGAEGGGALPAPAPQRRGCV